MPGTEPIVSRFNTVRRLLRSSLSVVFLMSVFGIQPAAAQTDQYQATAPSVRLTVNRTFPSVTSALRLGVTHTQHSLDPDSPTVATDSARQLLAALGQYQNQHLMGWGAGNPEPSPGVFDWASLDRRMQLVNDTQGIPVLTLCCAPDWMKGLPAGRTDWSKLEAAPIRSHYQDFANLAAAAARRYPNVRYFQVWNELKGFYSPRLGRWDYEAYTDLYNAVYDALKAVNPDNQVGGPYVVIDTDSNHSKLHPSSLSGPYGTVDQRSLDAIQYWLTHNRGADFIAVDNRPQLNSTNLFQASQEFEDVANWIHARTALPLWWSEWYATPWGQQEFNHEQQNAALTSSLLAMMRSGVSMALRWQPQGNMGDSYQGDTESLWSDVKEPGGGQPFPFYSSTAMLAGAFPAGTPLYPVVADSPSVDAIASESAVLVVNKTNRTLILSVASTTATLAPFQVSLIEVAPS
jgi:hypothetical protein